MTETHFWQMGHALRVFSDPPFLKLTDAGIEIEGVGLAVCRSAALKYFSDKAE